MKKFVRFTIEILIEALNGFSYIAKSNLRNLAWLLNLLTPFIMYFIGQYVVLNRGYFGVGGEILIPILILFVIYFLRSMANKYRKGTTIPVPEERFTEVDDDGEVSVRNDRLQELILYLADLEDWLERKGLL